jgi:hypothetical protein
MTRLLFSLLLCVGSAYGQGTIPPSFHILFHGATDSVKMRPEPMDSLRWTVSPDTVDSRRQDSLDAVRQETYRLQQDKYIAYRLVRLWDGYAKECWEDSTLHPGSPREDKCNQDQFQSCRFKKDQVDTTAFLWSCDDSTHMEYSAGYGLTMRMDRVPRYVYHNPFWTHRTPTIEGFIEWMRKR